MESSQQEFPSTLWSEVLSAGAGSSRALAVLCERYHRAVYAFIRRAGCLEADARDLTQDFLAFILEGHVLQHADPSRGRFRPFIRTCVRNFLNNQRERAAAKKRGGDQQKLRLDVGSVEHLLPRLQGDGDPDAQFEIQWALDLLTQAVTRLKQELSPEALQIFQLAHSGEGLTLAQIGARLGMKEDAAGQAVSRPRARLRRLIRDELASTLGPHEDVDAELAELIRAVSRSGRLREAL